MYRVPFAALCLTPVYPQPVADIPKYQDISTTELINNRIANMKQEQNPIDKYFSEKINKSKLDSYTWFLFGLWVGFVITPALAFILQNIL